MKRSSIVVLVLIAGITAMIWAGVMAYRIRKSLHTQPVLQATMTPSNQTGAAVDKGSPAAEDLPDLRSKQAPAFTLKTVDGKTVSLADYKGKAVLVNFWATWCGPCKLEMPWLIDAQKKYSGQGFTVLGLSEDDDSAKKVGDFAATMGVNYPVLMANENVSNAYGGADGISYLPVSFYIGRDGKVLAEVGGLISQSEIDANIQKIIATKGA